MEGATYNAGASPVTIAPLGDIQWDGHADKVALRHLNAHLDECDRRDALYVGMGDYIDFASPSNRQKLRGAALYDSAKDVIDRAATVVTDEIAEILSRTSNRWLGLLAGHHYYEFEDGTTSDTRLSETLGAPFLGDCAYVRLSFVDGNHTGSVLLWAHHGSGNGKSASAGLTKLEDVAKAFDADIYLMGHTSKRGALPINRVEAVFHGASFRLRHREQWLVNTGCWLRAYREGNKHRGVASGDYVEKAMMRPVSLGAPIITVTPRWKAGAFDPSIKVEA